MAVCSSVCHSDYCHNQGICTHHPHQPPLCQCPVGDHFWFMGRRCDVRMTQQWLVGACLGVLVAIVTLIGAVAWLAVRRYRAMLIKTKVDQTRSSYRRFNHFDELSVVSGAVHRSQYGWAVSEVSLAECVLDSGKASDLSVRALRPRSYCEGMELVELEKSWTA
ncbi:interphotoreceptor matrix proteoglycan 2-like [Oncorhynchus masou masou]|uniref:interphotoreceptor matrix proteoglycan 2-like n=1 Tax=Oncorhynchus masou masou TaxID=90313 RepID=UPI0031846A79